MWLGPQHTYQGVIIFFYDAYNLEALAVAQAIKKWRVYIEGSAETTLATDHNTLTRLLTHKPGDLSKRQVGWVETLMPLANC